MMETERAAALEVDGGRCRRRRRDGWRAEAPAVGELGDTDALQGGGAHASADEDGDGVTDVGDVQQRQ